MLVIGLTGGIASGKSTVSDYLRQLGAVIVDADKVGHEAYLPHTDAWREVVAAFGRQILGPDEQIDRPRLGQIVFSDPKAMARLNEITHPKIRSMVAERLEALRRDGVKVAVLEAAILIEASWSDLADQVWVTWAPEEMAIRRLMERSNLTEEQARARLASQMPPAEKIQYADVIINNEGTFEQVREQVVALWQQCLAGAPASESSD